MAQVSSFASILTGTLIRLINLMLPLSSCLDGPGYFIPIIK